MSGQLVSEEAELVDTANQLAVKAEVGSIVAERERHRRVGYVSEIGRVLKALYKFTVAVKLDVGRTEMNRDVLPLGAHRNGASVREDPLFLRRTGPIVDHSTQPKSPSDKGITTARRLVATDTLKSELKGRTSARLAFVKNSIRIAHSEHKRPHRNGPTQRAKVQRRGEVAACC